MLVSLRKKQEAKENLDFLVLPHLRRLVVKSLVRSWCASETNREARLLRVGIGC